LCSSECFQTPRLKPESSRIIIVAYAMSGCTVRTSRTLKPNASLTNDISCFRIVNFLSHQLPVKYIRFRNIWGFHSGDYEECRILGYKDPVCSLKGTHYVSATETSRLMLRKILCFQGGDYEECRLLGYKNPVLTSQETYYVSVTESSQLILCKIWGFLRMTIKNAVFWDVTPCGSYMNLMWCGWSSPNPRRTGYGPGAGVI
jgi:hypothetical protein